jgi:hypothetical protein
MSVAEHNPSRRALLGAAVALSFDTPVRQAHRLLRMSEGGAGDGAASERWTPDQVREDDRQVRGDGRWDRALATFEAAEAVVAEVEQRTAGAPWEEQDAVEEEYGDALDVLNAALRRLFRVPAPDIAALAVKIELLIDHEVAMLNGGEACMAALRRDALRLSSGQALRLSSGQARPLAGA